MPAHLLSIEDKIHCLTDKAGEIKTHLNLFVDIADLSLNQALASARTTIELIVHQIMAQEQIQFSPNLMNNIEILGSKDPLNTQKRGGRPPILTPPVYSALHSLRIYGNLVVHPVSSNLDERKDRHIRPVHAQVALAQLLCVIEWYFTEYVQPPVDPLYTDVPAPVLGHLSDVPPYATGIAGRDAELSLLDTYLRNPRTRIVFLLAPGGIGKSALASLSSQSLCGPRKPFSRLLWFDLQHDPPLGEIMNRWIQSLSGENQTGEHTLIETRISDRISMVLRRLVDSKGLTVLDNLETWIDTESRQPRESYLSQLLTEFSAASHCGKLVITTRLMPKIECPDMASVRILKMKGLDAEQSVALMESLGLKGMSNNLFAAAGQMGGNPQLIKLLAYHTLERYHGSLDSLMEKRPTFISSEARQYMEEIFRNLPPVAQKLLRILSICPGSASCEELSALLCIMGESFIPDDIEDLIWQDLVPRALVVQHASEFSFQLDHPLIGEYIRNNWPDKNVESIRFANYYEQQIPKEPSSLPDYTEMLKAIHYYLEGFDETDTARLLLNTRFSDDLIRWGMTQKLLPFLEKYGRMYPLGGPSDESRIRVHRCLAATLLRGGELESPRQILENCCRALNTLRGTGVELMVLKNLTVAYRACQMFSEAQATAQTGLALAQTIGTPDDVIEILIDTAILMRSQGRFREAARHALEAEKLLVDACEADSFIQCYLFLGYHYKSSGNFDLAQSYLTKCQEHAKKRNHTPTLARLTSEFADIARENRNYSSAIDLYHESIRMRQEIDDLAGEAIARTGLAMAQFYSGNVDTALENLKISIRIPFDLERPREVASRLANLAMIYISADQTRLAAGCILAAIDVFDTWHLKIKKWQRRLSRIRDEASKKNATWSQLELQVRNTMPAVLEEATGISRKNWSLFLQRYPKGHK